jgi:hypothetical protein
MNPRPRRVSWSGTIPPPDSCAPAQSPAPAAEHNTQELHDVLAVAFPTGLPPDVEVILRPH